MKIAIVVPGGVDRSGVERVIPCLLWLIERLAAEDDVHVFALHQEPKPGRWPLLGAQVVNAGGRLWRMRALLQLLAEHRRGRFDVVHAFWAAGPGPIAAVFSKATDVPLVVTLPGGDLVGLPDIGYGAQLTRRGRLQVRFALAQAAAVVVPNRWMAAQALAFGMVGTVIPYGVALDRWPVLPPRRRTEPVLRLVHVANLNPVKDQPTLLAAMRDLRDRGIDFRLDIIGLDTMAGAMQRLSDDLGLARHVVFHGFLPQPEVRRLVEQADLHILTSRSEAAAIAVLGAAEAGVPTVGTAVGPVADWSPAAALAVPVGDAAALAAAIAALAGDEPRRLALAARAQAIAVADDADACAARTRALYRRIAYRQNASRLTD